MFEWEDATASELKTLFASGSLSPLRYARHISARNAELDPHLAIWAHYDEEAFLRSAEKPRAGPLHGLPVAVKDIFDTYDLPTECGSTLLRGRRPNADAAAVAALRSAGGIVIGKTVTTEFAYAHPGATRNPGNPLHTPGGSSSGSAAAVAAGLVPLAIGTQTAGSIIRPAAFCGVVGFKPTFGWINRGGVMPFAESLDTVGGFARSAADAWLLIEIMGGEAAPQPLREPQRPPRIGFCRTHWWNEAAPDVQRTVDAAADALSDAGAEIGEVSLPDVGEDLQGVHLEIMAHEASRVFAHYRAHCPTELSSVLMALIEKGEAISPDEYRKRLRQAERARIEATSALWHMDVVLTPSAINEAPEGLASTGDALFNRVWTLLHGPAVHLPFGTGTAGLPLGVQLVAAPWRDRQLAEAALWAQRTLAER